MITDIVGGLGAGVGVDLAPDGTIAYVVEWSNGELIRVDIRTGEVETVLTGLSFPQDVIRHWDTGRMFVSERTGTIRQVFGPNESTTIDRSGGAPHQLALSPQADRLYVACYDSGELRMIDLATSVSTVLFSGLGHPVGLLVDDTERTAWVTEQDSGRISVIDLTASAVVETVGGLTAPFFLAFDAPRTGVHCVQRDPSNSLQQLAFGPLRPTTVTTGLAWRPSGVGPNADDSLIAIATDQKLQVISAGPLPPIVPPPTPFTVETVRFDDDRGMAIPLNFNATTPVSTPEWVAGVRSHPAVYEMGTLVRIQVTLRRGPGWTPGAAYALGAVGTLGGVRRATVTPVFDPSGISAPIAMEFMYPLPGSVQALSVALDWYARRTPGAVVPVQVGSSWHRILTVLRRPVAEPWVSRRPWASVLDRACSFAAGAADEVAAAAAVTQAYNASGVVSYDTVSGATAYGFTTFQLTEMLERLAGGIGLGGKVNCTDSANTVSTLANVLGCELWQSRMESNFDLNPVLAIGTGVWTVPFDGGFSYHEVAWTSGATATDPIYDGCLHVDGDADPVTAPHTPMLPINMVFGDCGSLTYRRRLCHRHRAGAQSASPSLAPGNAGRSPENHCGRGKGARE
jgi:YVTN family beta-propeller protein